MQNRTSISDPSGGGGGEKKAIPAQEPGWQELEGSK
jgi:hypothetical protein